MIAPADMLVPSIAGPKTVVVLGAFRGGTSFVAEILYRLGVPMGVDYDPAAAVDYSNYENHALARLLTARDWPAVEAYVQQQNEAHDLWGWKWPPTVFHLPRVLPLLRNPHLIAVTRDPVACWQGDYTRGGSVSLTDMIWHCFRVASVLFNPSCPCLAVSFERGRLQTEATISAVAKFLELAPRQ